MSKILYLNYDPDQYSTFHSKWFVEIFEQCESFDYVNYYKVNGKKNLENKILSLINKNCIDICIIALENYDLDIYFLEKLSKIALIVLFHFDDERFFDVRSQYYSLVSHGVITTSFESVSSYQALGIPSYFYLSSYDEKSFKNENIRSLKEFDISFVGIVRNKINRQEYIKVLQDYGFNIRVFGNGNLKYEEMIDIFQKSKINLNFTSINNDDWCSSSKINLLKKQLKGRITEIAMGGGCV